MQKLCVIISLILISTFLAHSQSLSVEETVDYINEYWEKYPTREKFMGEQRIWTHKIEVFNNGDFEDKQYLNEGYKTDLNKTVNFNINDLVLSKTNIDKIQYFRVLRVYDKWEENYSFFTPDLKDNYDEEKYFNALKYLFSSVQQSTTYKRNDTDPFSPDNFKSDVIYGTDNSVFNIPLVESNGVYTVTLYFGSLKKTFILDSGASDINISSELEKTLISHGLITKSDYLESGLYKLADGSIVLCRRLIIKKIKIGSLTVSNVLASVGGSNTPLLLGRSMLDKFNKWSIDNEKSELVIER